MAEHFPYVSGFDPFIIDVIAYPPEKFLDESATPWKQQIQVFWDVAFIFVFQKRQYEGSVDITAVLVKCLEKTATIYVTVISVLNDEYTICISPLALKKGVKSSIIRCWIYLTTTFRSVLSRCAKATTLGMSQYFKISQTMSWLSSISRVWERCGSEGLEWWELVKKMWSDGM